MVHHKFEMQLIKSGYRLVAGVDEAGCGPLAGPVFAAAVILPGNCRIRGLDDSKKLSPEKREKLFGVICDRTDNIGIGFVLESEIDRINILRAKFKAMLMALTNLRQPPDFVLVDGNRMVDGLFIPQRAVIKGDGICSSIAAASIIAKVSRDRYMRELHRQFPEYGFDAHKGYGTKKHYEAIAKFGLSPVHRRTFVQ